MARAKTGMAKLHRRSRKRRCLFCILVPVALAVLSISTILLHARRAATPALLSRTQGVVFTLLIVGLFQESWALLTALWMRQSSVGQLSVGKVALPSARHVRASSALAFCYVVVLATNYVLFYTKWLTSHMDPFLDRPVCTLRYASWLSTVPLMMWITGGLMLEHPARLLGKPIILTAIYLIMAFTAQFFTLVLRIPLIAVTFFLFFWASVLQLRWIDRQKPLASTLVFVEVLAFALYSVIFLLGQAAWISPAFESCAYTLFDTGVKLVHSLVVLTMRWTTEVWSFHTVLRNHVDLLVETRGLVRSHVDVLLQCRRSRAGLVITGSHPFLEHGVGKDLAGKLLEEICFSAEDREKLLQYQSCHIAAEGPDVLLERMTDSAWTRQVSVSKEYEVPRPLQMNILFVGLPSNRMPVKLLINAGDGSESKSTVMVGLVLDYNAEHEDKLNLDPYGHLDGSSEGLSEDLTP